jgi:hypothetical protein
MNVATGNFFSRNKLLIAVLAGIGILYSLTLSVNHSEAEDCLYSIVDITQRPFADQFETGHLFFGAVNKLLYRGFQLFGYQGTAEAAIKTLNIIASLGGLAVLFMIGSYVGFPSMLRYLILLLVAFSFGYWWYSVESEVYIPPIPFLLLSLHRLLLIREDFLKKKHHVILGLLHAAAIVLHQQHILFGFVILVGYAAIFVEKRATLPFSRFLGGVFLYGCVGVFTVIFSYLGVAVWARHLSSFPEIYKWFLGDAGTGRWGFWSLSAIWKAPIGFLRAIIGSHFVFSFPDLANYLQMKIPTFLLREEVYMTKDFSAFRSIALVVLTSLFFLLALFIFVKMRSQHALRRALMEGTFRERARLLFVITAASFAIYAVFNIWWEPQNLEFWISPLPFLLLALSVPLSRIIHEKKMQIILWMMVVCLFLSNLFGSILPQNDRELDYWYIFNRWIIHNCGPGDLVISGAGYISDGYIMLYSGADEMGTWDETTELEQKFQDRVMLVQPKRIFFSSTILNPPHEMTSRFAIDVSYARNFFERRRKDLKLVHSDEWQDVFLYEPPRE